MFKLPQDKKGFIPFIMAGVPDLKTTKEALLFLDTLNVAAIELGVPFTDPIADGPINQEASKIALSNKTTLRLIFSMLDTLIESNFKTPIILFTYLNPILSLGFDQFITLAKKAKVQSVLVVDLPIEEGGDFYQALHSEKISPVFLVSPTTQLARYQSISSFEPAFIYYISRCAVTGLKENIRENLVDEVSTLKAFFPKESIAVGFGISSAQHAKEIANYANGVIVGSALMHHLNRDDFNSFKSLCCEIQHAVLEASHEKI